VETVTISGEGWYPIKMVSFNIKEIPSIDEVFLNFTVQADLEMESWFTINL
jgi:hypothetical protein